MRLDDPRETDIIIDDINRQMRARRERERIGRALGRPRWGSFVGLMVILVSINLILVLLILGGR